MVLTNKNIILLSDVCQYSVQKLSRYIGPYVIANNLRKAGYTVVVIDWFTEKENFFEYLENFIDSNTIAIGLSSTFLTQSVSHLYKDGNKPLRTDLTKNYFNGYLWQNNSTDFINWCQTLRDLLDKYNTNCKIVLGGAKSQFLFKNKLNNADAYKNIDYVITGAADTSMVYLCDCISDNTAPQYVESNGIKFIHSNLVTPYDACESMEWQPSDAVGYKEALPIEISRGCVFSCKFCHYEKRKSTRKPIADLKTELTRNYELYGTQFYHFCDDCFNDNPDKVYEICNMIQTLNFPIEWISYARVDVGVKFPDTMTAMMESGCSALWFGLETFNYKSGRLAGKAVPPDKVKEALLNWRHKFKDQLLLQASFIVGLPEETEETQLETITWLEQNDVLDFASFGVLGIIDYSSDIDYNSMDYADYSRNPEKFGFKKVSWQPYYWEHNTMNSDQADELANICSQRWSKSKGNTFVKGMWQYPRLRGLGYSKNDIIKMSRQPDVDNYWYKDLESKSRNADLDYWDRLIKNAHRICSQ